LRLKDDFDFAGWMHEVQIEVDLGSTAGREGCPEMRRRT
jgi:hypothetical protein